MTWGNFIGVEEQGKGMWLWKAVAVGDEKGGNMSGCFDVN
jgi:hypothetical protein